MAELAPRDVVARAIMREGIDERSGEALPVYLDMRHVTGKDLRARFPGISARLDEYGFDLSRDLIPIRPAAHYLMGGVRTDLYGRTNVAGLVRGGRGCLYRRARGESASQQFLVGRSGVWAAGGGSDAGGRSARRAIDGEESKSGTQKSPSPMPDAAEVNALREKLRNLMWQYAGLLRDEAGLSTIQKQLEAMRGQLPPSTTRENAELRNMHTVAELIVASALARKESRGAHARTDFPQHDPARRSTRAWSTAMSILLRLTKRQGARVSSTVASIPATTLR